MHRITRQIAVLLIFCSSLFTTLQAQTTDCFALMLERLPGQPPQTNTVWKCPKFDKGFGINVRHDSNGDLSHLGLHFFPDAVREYNDPIICDCIERLLLQLSIEEIAPIQGIKTWMKQQKVSMTLNGFSYGKNSFPNLDAAFNYIRKATQVSIDEREKEYVLTVATNDGYAFVLSFQKERSLIFGTDKHESDQKLASAIKNAKESSIPKIELNQSDRLTPSPVKGIFQHTGEAYLIDRLRSTTYHKMTTLTSDEPVNSDKIPEYSLTNILLLAVGNADMIVNLTHKVYGLTPIISQVRWGDLMTVLATKGTRLYAASRISETDSDSLTGVLVLYNPHYEYINMLMVSVKKAELFDANAPQMSATLYTNVPQGNVLDLFQ